MLNKIKKNRYWKWLFIFSFTTYYLLLTTHYLYAVGFSGDFSQSGGAIYDGGSNDGGGAIAVDTITVGGPYIYVLIGSSVGATNDTIIAKYDSFGNVITTATFHSVHVNDIIGSDSLTDIDIDNSGNVYVCGRISTAPATNWQDSIIIKYNSSLVLLSSVTFNTNVANITAGIAVNKNTGDIYVTGWDSGGGILTVKYDFNLIFQSSATFGDINGGEDIDIDNNGNVYVCGNTNPTGPEILKYNSSLVLISSTIFTEGSTQFLAIAVDSNGYVYVTGWWYDTYTRYLTVKYNSSLTYITRTIYGNKIDDGGTPYDIAIDNSDNIYVTGIVNSDYLTIKYSPSLVILSSAVYDGVAADYAQGIEIDDNGNVYVTGATGNVYNHNDCRTIRYSPSEFNAFAPMLSWTGETGYTSDGLEPYTGTSITTFTYRVKYTDSENDAPKSEYPKVHIKKGGTEISGSPFTMDYVSGNYNTGAIYSYSIDNLSYGSDYTYYFEAYDIADAAATGNSTSLLTGPTVYLLSSSETVLTDEEKTITITPETGEIEIKIPPRTFSDTVSITVSTMTVPSSDRGTIKVTNIGIEITTDKGLQPAKEITITINYRDDDVAGFDETKLVLSRYDETYLKWITLPSTAYPDQNKVVGRTNHLSRFAVVQLVPTSDLNTMKVYPNPFNPNRHTQGLTIENITAQATIKIYTIAGELVREIEETDGDGISTWDGRNDAGNDVASGVYIGFIEGPSDTKKVKIAVER